MSITFRYVRVIAAVDSNAYREIQIRGRRIDIRLVALGRASGACMRTGDIAARYRHLSTF